jgi:hypothetical protein
MWSELSGKYMDQICKWQLITKSVSIGQNFCFRHIKTDSGRGRGSEISYYYYYLADS